MSLIFLIQVRALVIIGAPIKLAMLLRFPRAIMSPVASWYVGAVARALVRGAEHVEKD